MKDGVTDADHIGAVLALKLKHIHGAQFNSIIFSFNVLGLESICCISGFVHEKC